ncbi:MAG TPA: hypothetical protein VEJ63_24485 [Planctomycetota bacterium]|nr:hypothetical protein [Planctomycetota bacterium]
MRFICPLCVLCAIASVHVGALEGSLSPAIKSQIESENFWMNYNGLPVKDYVRELNKLKSLKVGVDSKLADIKTVPKLEFKDKNVVSATEVLAASLNAKVYYLRDFLYIAKELPAGITPTFAGDPPKADAKDPKADPKNPAPAAPAAAPKADAPPPVLTKLPAIFPGRAPGNSKIVLWQRKTPDEVRKEERPVVLLVADGDEKNDNVAAWFFDTLLLEDPACLKALVDFTFIRTGSIDAGGWPASVTSKVKKGSAALMLLTHDGTVQNTWADANPALTPQTIAAAAAQVVKQNDAIKGKLPPPKEVAAKDEEKKDERKGKIPGLPPPKKKEGEEEDEPEEKKPNEKKPAEKKPDPGKKAPPKNNGMGGPADE